MACGQYYNLWCLICFKFYLNVSMSYEVQLAIVLVKRPVRFEIVPDFNRDGFISQNLPAGNSHPLCSSNAQIMGFISSGTGGEAFCVVECARRAGDRKSTVEAWSDVRDITLIS